MIFKFNKENVPQLSDDEELIFEKNLVWVFGSARGGTTWVARDLLSYNTDSINEPHIDEHLAARANEIHDKIVRRIDTNSSYSDYFFSEKYRETWIFYLRKLILHRFYAQTKRLDRKTIIKEVDTWGTADILSECLSNSKIIILLRDGRDVIDSLIDARKADGFMTKNSDMTPLPGGRNAFIISHSKLWVTRNEIFLKAYNNRNKTLRYMVKYENLLDNTFDELKKLYNFIEIDISDEELQKIVKKYSFANIPKKEKGSGKFVRSATPGLWKKNFSNKEKDIMKNIMLETLVKLGYEP